MKVNRKDAVALLAALGFPKAAGWGYEKIIKWLEMLPRKVPSEDYPEKHEELCQALAETDSPIELVGGAEETPAPKSKKSSKSSKTKKSSKSSKTKKSSKSSKTKQSDESPAKDSKPAKSKKAKKPAKPAEPKKEKKEVVRDAFGCAVGTISSQVNAILDETWKDEKEIAEEAKVSLDQARGRLYYAADQKLIEVRRRIEYRLVPAPSSKKGK